MVVDPIVQACFSIRSVARERVWTRERKRKQSLSTKARFHARYFNPKNMRFEVFSVIVCPKARRFPPLTLVFSKRYTDCGRSYWRSMKEGRFPHESFWPHDGLPHHARSHQSPVRTGV